ncbi:MAG: lipid-A-disaccharide synthase [Alphaproteobacteria bacterium]|nr:lipid-A-disaccharide synthase [Alphaproteobacteria bacterium]
MTVKVYLVAGEASGDLLGARLMRALKHQKNEEVAFYGVGGETMQAEGLNSLFDIKDLSVMGFMEVIPSVPKILRHLKEIISDIKQIQPDVILTIDSYSFSIRVHQAIKKNKIDIPHAHYVAPQVWAWNKGRTKILPKWVDHLFCLLPNEPEYFTPYGLPTTFVGHPVIEGGADKGEAQKFRTQYNLDEKTPVLALLPGSRKNEIKTLLPVFMQVAEKVSETHPDLFVVVPTVQTVADKITLQMKDWKIPHTIVLGERARYDAFAAANVAIAASGTVSLELAMAKVPHLIAYRLNAVTAFLAKLVLKIKYVNLINLLQDKEIIPELLQENCTVKKIFDTAENLFQNSHQDVLPSLKKLGLNGNESPSEKVASCLLKLAGREKNDG